METALALVLVLTVVVAVESVAEKVRLPAPLMLIALGAAVSYLPFIPEFELTPDLVLIGLLPPLLYSAAIKTSLVDFGQNWRPIALLSVGLVIFTAAGVGLLMWLILPIGLAPAMALGAVVAPPDAVAATTIARRIGMPRQLVTILEGEGLVNDATAIVLLRVTIAAIAGTVTVWEVGAGFFVSAVGGVVVGVFVAWIGGKVRRSISGELSEVSVSLLTPWAAYVVAEELHVPHVGAPSGILAVVVAGLILGHRSPLIQSASTRLIERTNWSMISFVLEGAVFFLIGLQFHAILEAVATSSLSMGVILLAAVGALVAVIVLRILWVFPSTYLSHMVIGARLQHRKPPWQEVAILSWAGMRGVVTLAAAFLLPADTPQREVLVAIALFVTAGTLLIHSSTLPWLVRRLAVHGPTVREDDLEEAQIRQAVSKAGLKYLDGQPDDAMDGDVRQRLRDRSNDRANAVWERLGDAQSPSVQYSRERSHMLGSEREELLRIRSLGTVDQTVLQRVMDALDVEESILDRLYVDEEDAREDAELLPTATGDCEHLRGCAEIPSPLTPEGCEECLGDGTKWVALRLCLDCGHVGCCDSSRGRHAEAHSASTSHPVVRSFEPGEAWRWCYVDDLVG